MASNAAEADHGQHIATAGTSGLPVPIDPARHRRFEVLGLHADRALIRQLARRLTTNDPAATRLRSTVSWALANEESKTGGILAVLRRATLVGADLDLTRTREGGRGTDL